MAHQITQREQQVRQLTEALHDYCRFLSQEERQSVFECLRAMAEENKSHLLAMRSLEQMTGTPPRTEHEIMASFQANTRKHLAEIESREADISVCVGEVYVGGSFPAWDLS